jgi:chromosome partitioning protein
MKEAVMLRMPVGHHKPRSAAAVAIDALAQELLDRLDSPRIASTGEAA